jgi:hypothetical protein
MKYLTAYSYDVQAQVRKLIETQRLGELLLKNIAPRTPFAMTKRYLTM